jgi:anti-repressor protein
MNELVTINESNKQFPISARELYEKLGYNSTHWSGWYQLNILRNEFAYLNKDFEVYAPTAKTFGGRPSQDFNLTIDFAKRLCMMARTETGEEIRKYFIEIEKRYQMQSQKIPTTFAEALRLAADLEDERQKLIPKAEYFDALVDRNLLTNFRETAKELKVKESYLIQWLLDKRYLYRDIKSKLQPYAQYVPTLFELKEYRNPKTDHVGNQTLVTPKGRETFRLLIA